jgi:hypothetical protein
MKKEEAFRDALAGCLHLRGGQLPRGPLACGALMASLGQQGYTSIRALWFISYATIRQGDRQIVSLLSLASYRRRLATCYTSILYIRLLVDMLYRESCARPQGNVLYSPLLF